MGVRVVVALLGGAQLAAALLKAQCNERSILAMGRLGHHVLADVVGQVPARRATGGSGRSFQHTHWQHSKQGKRATLWMCRDGGEPPMSTWSGWWGTNALIAR